MPDINTYIQDRVDDQIRWHSRKARENKEKFHIFQIITIVSGSIVPLVNVVDFLPLPTRIISAILGSLITIVTSITQLKKYEQNWLNYRRTSEALRREKYLFVHDAGEYSTKEEKEKSKLFVQKVETILESVTEMATKKDDKEKEDVKR
jgi:Protein of unknown function (DUF4231)